ncbi:YihY/virulence factor BrkB family protein [Halobacterium sp. R2-5]|uniref:YihY/virulence factor BrkB family protein n=1 Tax=Halobacterium sp. R2-5 TaxID=2715751 RepID=UPI0014248416|nr:YihY/virulence factor BrkB family protein [Halobacterium sp. R2-5]NIC00473.1 YihY/virulence factor BrkB family protein [Halobacterium sp. R2-5]
MSYRGAFDGSARELVVAVVALSREQGLSVTAAGVAYYTFTALLPMLVLGVLAVSASGYVGLAAERVTVLANVSPRNVLVVAQAVEESQGFGRLTALATAVATWSSLSLGHTVSQVFEDVYEDVGHTPLERIADVVVVFLTWLAALLLVLAVGIALAFLQSAVVVSVGWPLVLFVALVAVFLPMYLVFPNAVSFRDALPGTAFAAAVWTLSALVLRAYAMAAPTVRLFGAVGAVLLVLTWLYVGSLALLVGAATNAVLAERPRKPRT